ncbi:MAG: formimidoylglutamate deiminase [Actinobacteria bacterium]|nr:formimidoylglutamate deiminase [Actinomycetota bacterium]
MTSYFAAHAWLPGGVADDVRITVDAGRFTSIEAAERRRPDDVALPGLVLPGFADTHSHAFHRALRGRTHGGGGTFWTWREQMYAVADRLTPATYFELARAVFAELALAGVTSVGEFHYVHHDRDARPYDDPNAMGAALIAAARAAGIRITLLDTCYLAGGLGSTGHEPLSPRQARFGDGTAAAWAKRLTALERDYDSEHGVRIGAAIHSVRAVPADELPVVVEAASGRPLHVHLSEQPAENAGCQRVYGCTPTELLERAGALSSSTTAVHATHLTDADIARLGERAAFVSFCPTTERDLADGIGPAAALTRAGARLVLGSDQHAVIDLIEEARAVELHERLATRSRGCFAPPELTVALTETGQQSLGWPDAGRIEVGARADLVAVRLDSVRTAGIEPDQFVFAATAADVDTVIADGRVVVLEARHALGDVAGLLTESLAALRS